MESVREGAIAVLLGVGFLHIFLRVVRTGWPESYFGGSDTTALAITSSPVRYALYRLAPLYVVSVFVAVTLERRDGYALSAVLLVGVIHGLMTNGAALSSWARRPALRRHRVPIAMVRAAVLLGLVLTAYTGYLSRAFLDGAVPSLGEMTAALWTALLAGIAGVYIGSVSQHDQGSASELVERSLDQIDPDLRALLVEEARTSGVDRHLALAVMTVENLQRPRWFRALERVKARLVPHGTYGIMQVTAEGWLSDVESIRLAVTGPLADARLPHDDIEVDAALRDFARRYNPDPTYTELLTEAYWLLKDRYP